MATQKRYRDPRTMNSERYEELRTMLEERRREILGAMQEKIRDVRAEGSAAPSQGVRDEAESSAADFQDDIEFALLQMKAETLQRIDEALARLVDASYGCCDECGEEIAERRLRALPFAVRCKDCEENREATQQRERSLAHRTQRPGPGSLFADLGE